MLAIQSETKRHIAAMEALTGEKIVNVQYDLGEYPGAIGDAIEIEHPTQGAKYSTGADWAKKKDYTVQYDIEEIELENNHEDKTCES